MLSLIMARCLATVRHGGAHHGPNAIIQVTAEEFEALKAEGKVAALEEAEPSAPAAEKPEDRTALLDEIIEAMGKVAKEEFGKDGKPNVKPLEAVLGYDIKAQDRDDALERLAGLLKGGE
jgi:hypothetical protein